jgi:SAM-dependent methyltransferase
MITDSQLPELRTLRAAERNLPVVRDDTLGALVSPQANELTPVHRWFRFKESFSPAFVRRIVGEAAHETGNGVRLLDPFCGVGTTLLAAQNNNGIAVSATGIEYNPFIHFVAQTKAHWMRLDPAALIAAGERALAVPPTGISLPQTTSILSERCVSRHVARRLVAIREHIMSHAGEGTRSGLLLGVAAAIESLSRTRKDGRALRLVHRARPDVGAALRFRWGVMADDLLFMQATRASLTPPLVLRGDGRAPSALGLLPDSYDLILTSPPYPNNIDYTEVYKLELWLLDLVRSPSEFLELRRHTLRSHPTIVRKEPAMEFLAEVQSGSLRKLLWPLIERTSRMRKGWRARLLLGYFEDLYQSLREYLVLLRPGGRGVFVVGNSLHGGSENPYLIPTDLILAELGRRCGFELTDITVARGLRRRLASNHFLRESVVTLRKPNG